MSRSARAFAAVGLLAAAIAALPSLDWCPLAEWTASACEAEAESGSPATSCGASKPACAPPTCELAGVASCATATWPLCDPVPDPLPVGDRLWCIQPPITALAAKAALLAAPAPSTPLAILVTPPVLAPPAVALQPLAAPSPRPPTLRAAHAPPRPRAPPVA